METDVLIIGAGPTGLAFSAQLLRFGIPHIIVDKKPGTTPYSKALAVQARTLELYDQFGFADKLIDIGEIASGLKLFSGGRQRAEVKFGEMGKGFSPFPYVLVAEQGRHETLLYEHLTSHGQSVQWSSELVSLQQTDDLVTAQIKNENGNIETVTAKYLIACDGAKSLIRHSLGLEFGGSTFERMFYVADVVIDWKYGASGLFAFLMRRNLLMIFGMKGDRRFRIVGTFPEEYAKDEGDVLYSEIEEQICRDSKIEFDITHVNWFSTYKVHTRHVDRFSVGRVFMAGDAAHIHSPAGGQGMNTGIQDGYDLAWKLAYVIKGKASPKLLDTYNEERLPNAVQLTRTTDRLFAFVADPDPILSFIRLVLIPIAAPILLSIGAIRRLIFLLVSQIRINYRTSSLSKNDERFTVKAGDRMPWFEIDGQSIYDCLKEPAFHVIDFGVDCNADPEWAVNVKMSLTDKVKRTFGCNTPFSVVVRPDNYIGCISSDREFIHRYFADLK